MQPLTKKVLTLVLTIVALAVGQSAWAMSSFTVSSPQDNNTFRITRTGNTAVAESIDWRVVSLSAMAGMHFTGYQGNYSGTVTFAANEPYKDITITETTPSGTNSDCFLYQNTTSRSYRFEVLDKNGDILASKDRTITTGTQFTNAYVNQSVTDLVYFTDNGNISSGSGNKYLDVSYSSSNWIQVTDGGYKQGVHTVSTNSLYNNTNLRFYLHNREYKMYATVYFTQKEEQDGYQYIQIYTGSAGTYDTGDDPNGGVNDPSNSLYKACFILSYSPSGSVMSDSHYQFFPHRYDYVDKATETSHNITHYEFDYGNSHLYQQKFKTASPSYKASNSGSLVLTTAIDNIHIRFDAGGSDGDTWDFKDLKVRLALVDNAAPIVINNYMVSGGRHQKGNTIYVSVPFKEIVTVTGTPTLASNWGTLSYVAGSGSNVLTFRGTIDPTDNNPFSVSGYSLNGGTIKDLAGNSFSGSISHSFGTTLDEDYVWAITDFNSLGVNTYEVTSKTDLRHLALLVNEEKNNCGGLTFLQTQDITCDNTYIPIGNYFDSFKGTYDGQGHTISGITVTRTGTETSTSWCLGLFGQIKGTVQNVVLSNSSFIGYYQVGGIVGYNNGGTVQNCRVESSVTIKAGNDNATDLGGIVGENYESSNVGTIIGCISAATVSDNGKNNTKEFGGIVGRNYQSIVQDCLYTGTTVSAASNNGAIVGYYSGTSTYTNNYYTNIDLGGVNGSDRDGARRARTVTLGDNVALVGDETAYNLSGLTAIGTGNYALRSGSTIYSGEGQTLTLSYTSEVSEGYLLTYSATAGTIDGNTLTMPAANVTVSSEISLIDFADDGHSGDSEADAYIIYNKEQLDMLATRVNSGTSNYYNKFFKLGADITYDGTANNYTPIGTSSSNRFRGTFDGDGHTVSGININSDNGYQGLFGYVDGGTVKNVTLASSTITGHHFIGGIAGYIYDGTVQNCRVESNVTIGAYVDYSNNHGGIAGQASGTSTVSGCISAATVTNSNKSNCQYYGGIVGIVNDFHVTVRNCLALSATISAASNKGAIVGYYTIEKFVKTTLANNYYYNCTVGGNTTNIGTKNGDQDGARQARTVTLGENIVLVGDETAYSVSGLTAIGTGNYALSYNDGNTTTLYSGATQMLTLNSPAGYKISNAFYNDGEEHVIMPNEGVYGFTMPAANVTVSAAITIYYVDADGIVHENVEATILDNTMSELSAGTYLVNSDITFTDIVTTTGDVTLILADGCTMTLDNATHNKRGIDCGGDLTIYGQTEGTGKLDVLSTGGGINLNNHNYSQHSGTVYIRNMGIMYGIYNAVNFTFDGGILDVNSVSADISASNVNILSGQLNSHGTYIQSPNVVLGCSKPTDQIHVVGFHQSNVTIVDGQMLTDGTYVYFGRESSSNFSYKTLRRTTVTGVTLTKSIPDFADVTFDDTAETPISIPQNVKAYNINLNRTFTVGKPATLMLPFSMGISKISGADFYTYTGVTYNNTTHKWEATMTQVSSGDIAANTPYLVVPTAANITFEHYATLNTTTNSQQTTNGDWSFVGTYEKKTWTAGDVGNDYGFAATSGKATDGVTDVEAGDFVKLAAGAWIRPMRSYLTYTGGGNPFAGARRRAGSELPSRISVILVSANGETTEISDALRLNDKGQMTNDNFYDLQGRKIEKPTKGLYIHNGKKTVIK